MSGSNAEESAPAQIIYSRADIYTGGGGELTQGYMVPLIMALQVFFQRRGNCVFLILKSRPGDFI